jgi:ParB family chromosome partitioning protein
MPSNSKISFLDKFGANLEEDVAGSRDTAPASGSPVVGRSRMRNAARLSLDVIDVDPQHREDFNEEEIIRLSESLQAHGQLQPIRVRFDEPRGRYVLIAGERRLRAMKHAGWSEADVVIAEGDLSEKDILIQQVVENLLRVDLLPIERANAMKAMIDTHGWDQKRLAAELCVSEGTVSNSLKLLKLDKETQEKVDAGQIKATIAISSARKSRKAPAKTSRKPKAMTIRLASGKAVIEPKAGKGHADVLREALAAVEQGVAEAA